MATPPSKKDVATSLLEKGSVFIHLDPRGEHVVVPQAFRVQQELVLQFGYQMNVPIPDLELDDEAISGTLSFARRPFWCRIPWDAVFAVIGDGGRGVAFRGEGGAAARGAPEPKRSHLRSVGPDERADSPPDAPEGDGTCRACSIKWLDGVPHCPLCGASRAEAFVPSAGEVSAEESSNGVSEEVPLDPPPATKPKVFPPLRLVKK